MISRRELFFSGLRRVLAEAVAPRPEDAPCPAFLRPPGALGEAEFLEACTRCDACLVACPRESIRRAGHELGVRNEGTPVILAEAQPCWLCHDLPCIAACEPGALLPLSSPGEARMASVRIRDAACFSAQGSPCEVCSERCPTRPRAITWQMGEAPELHPERCTGCAVCAWLCPADAIDVVALAR